MMLMTTGMTWVTISRAPPITIRMESMARSQSGMLLPLIFTFRISRVSGRLIRETTKARMT